MSFIRVGSKIPAQKLPQVSRYPLALYANANPIHLDSDPAEETEVQGAFAHGVISIAYLGCMLSNWQPQARLLKFSTRSGGITLLQDASTCSGEVIELHSEGGETIARCAIQAVRKSGEQAHVGEVLVAL